MSPFAKYWITVTCAPESIKEVSYCAKGTQLSVGIAGRDMWYDEVYNEDRTKSVTVVSLSDGSISTCYKGNRNTIFMSFSDTCKSIAKLFRLAHTSVELKS